jgi:hypothetical protein
MREISIYPSSLGPRDPRSPCYRWVWSRKLALLNAISSGTLSIEDACDQFSVSMDELVSWQELMQQFGPKGLYATRQFRRRAIIPE